MSEPSKKPAAAGARKFNAAGALRLTRTRLRLDLAQDRVVLDGSGAKEERITLWLTRRLCLQVFQRLRAQMEKDSPAGKTPSAWRDEALALEHAAILKSAEGRVPVKPWAGESAPQLVSAMGLKTEGKRTQLIFLSGQKVLAIQPLAGASLHKFAAALAMRIQQSGWDQALDLSWLGKPPMPKPVAKKAN